MDEGEDNRTANGLSTGEYRKGEVVEVERNDGNVVFRVDHSDIGKISKYFTIKHYSRLPVIRTCTFRIIRLFKERLDLLIRLRQKHSRLFKLQLLKVSVIRSDFYSPRRKL